MTLQQIVLSKNILVPIVCTVEVLTLQQIVLSKNNAEIQSYTAGVLTLQQIVLSKNKKTFNITLDIGFDFTTNCSF